MNLLEFKGYSNQLEKYNLNAAIEIIRKNFQAFYIKELKREIGCTGDFYVQRCNDILNKIKQTPENVWLMSMTTCLTIFNDFIFKAMSKFNKKYANDLEDIVQHCSWYLYDSICIKQPSVDILNFFIDGLAVDTEAGYDKSIVQIRKILLNRMWKLVFGKYTNVCFIEKKSETYEQFQSTMNSLMQYKKN